MRIVYNSHSTIGTDMNTANKANILSTWEDTFGQLFFFFTLHYNNNSVWFRQNKWPIFLYYKTFLLAFSWLSRAKKPAGKFRKTDDPLEQVWEQ